jgi:ABC-type branched-subunit amino acid transport system permease subunit
LPDLVRGAGRGCWRRDNLLDSRIGRGIRALRGGSLAAEAFGVNIVRAKLIVFVFAAVAAALVRAGSTRICSAP